MKEIKDLQTTLSKDTIQRDGLMTDIPATEAADSASQTSSTNFEVPDLADMSEFSGTADDAPLEETLAQLSADPTLQPPTSAFEGMENTPPDEQPTEAAPIPAPAMVATPVPAQTAAPSPFIQATAGQPTPIASTTTSYSKESMSDTEKNESDGTLSLTLTGNMKLKLKWQYDGQEVSVGFSGDYLQIELPDGAEFKVPVKKRHLRAA